MRTVHQVGGSAVCLVLLVSLNACRSADDTGVTRSLDGPLIADVVAGGQSLRAPSTKTWWASFGAFGVCTEGPEVTIEGVRLVGGEEPLAIRQFVRRGETGYQGVLGAAPNWEQPYATFDDPSDDAGEYQEIPGAVISETCADVGNDRAPAVVPVIKTGVDGLRATRLLIDYSADGDEYSLEMPWEVILCGTEQPKDMC